MIEFLLGRGFDLDTKNNVRLRLATNYVSLHSTLRLLGLEGYLVLYRGMKVLS
jgi:hypothetical protein